MKPPCPTSSGVYPTLETALAVRVRRDAPGGFEFTARVTALRGVEMLIESVMQPAPGTPVALSVVDHDLEIEAVVSEISERGFRVEFANLTAAQTEGIMMLMGAPRSASDQSSQQG